MDQYEPDKGQLEKILSEVKLKEPKREEMNDYLSQVRQKIKVQTDYPRFHFAPLIVGLIFVAGLCALVYFNIKPKIQKESLPEVSTVVKQAPQTLNKTFTLEEEMKVLEAFSQEYPADTGDLFGDQEAAEEIILLDEVELSHLPAASSST